MCFTMYLTVLQCQWLRCLPRKKSILRNTSDWPTLFSTLNCEYIKLFNCFIYDLNLLLNNSPTQCTICHKHYGVKGLASHRISHLPPAYECDFCDRVCTASYLTITLWITFAIYMSTYIHEISNFLQPVLTLSYVCQNC